MNTKCAALITLSLTQSVHANNPIILWDIHGVLITRSNTLQHAWNYPDWRKLLTHSSFSLITELLSLSIQHLISAKSSEQFIEKARAHHNPYLEQLIIELVNAQRPIDDMKEIVDELHAAGYEQHIGSNIGKTAFHALIDPNKYPQLAPLFAPMNIARSLVISHEQGAFVEKPSTAFFTQYLQKNNLNPHTQSIIFVDDNATNIAAAQSMGFDGILFKDALKLRHELEKRNILIAPIEQPCTEKTLLP